MRIDIHAYVGHWPFRQLRGNSCEGLLAKMNEFGIDKAVISNINGIFYKNTQPANEELYQAVKPYRDRFIPFAIINPTYADWKYDLDVCCNDFEMKGLRLYPQYHDYEITNPACIDLVKAARDYDIPVAFSLRLTDLRQRSWLDVQKVRFDEKIYDEQLTLDDIATVVSEVPDAKYIVLHARPCVYEKEESINILKKAEIVFDTVRGSGVPVTGPNGYSIVQTLQKYGKEKVAFGTAAPFMDYCSPFIRIEVMKADEADEEIKQLLWSGNALRILGMRD